MNFPSCRIAFEDKWVNTRRGRQRYRYYYVNVYSIVVRTPRPPETIYDIPRGAHCRSLCKQHHGKVFNHPFNKYIGAHLYIVCILYRRDAQTVVADCNINSSCCRCWTSVGASNLRIIIIALNASYYIYLWNTKSDGPVTFTKLPPSRGAKYS